MIIIDENKINNDHSCSCTIIMSHVSMSIALNANML